MEQSDVLAADVQVTLDIEPKNGTLRCTFTGIGTISIPCDRCLEAMSHKADFVEKLTVKYGPEYDDSVDSLITVSESATYLDLSPLLRDFVMLTIPMRHVHPDGQCDPAMSDILRGHTAIPADEEADEDI